MTRYCGELIDEPRKEKEGYAHRGYRLGDRILYKDGKLYKIISLRTSRYANCFIGIRLSNKHGGHPSRISNVVYLEDIPVIYINPKNIMNSDCCKISSIEEQEKEFRGRILSSIKQELKDCELYTKDGKEFDFNSIEDVIESLLEYYDNKRGVY